MPIQLSVQSLLIRGMLVGLLGGVLALGFAKVFGEPEIDRAISFEEKIAEANNEPPEEQLVSRDVQGTFGLGAGVCLFGIALGGLFSLAFAVAYGRVGKFSVRTTSGLVALGAFVAIVLVPFLKYPANPPSVGTEETINERTLYYFTMILASAVAAVVAVRVGQMLRSKTNGSWDATIAGVAVFLLIVLAVGLIMPTVNEVPEGFPAATLWRFRIASLGTQAVLWGTIGLAFGALTERSLRATAARSVGGAVSSSRA
jgi:hypothetical protein